MQRSISTSHWKLHYKHIAVSPEATYLPTPAMGVEITIPYLASLCEYGNIDPQHLGTNPRVAAITEALKTKLPPKGTTLVTINPDPDSIGAMAVLELRANGQILKESLLERVKHINDQDCWKRGLWSKKESSLPIEEFEILALGILISQKNLSLKKRVILTMDWLVLGTCKNMDATKTRLIADIRIAREKSRVRVINDGLIAVLEYKIRRVWELGYAKAPVVIALPFEESLPRRVTIAQYDDSWIDMRKLALALSRIEQGWGGSLTICGSPQGKGSWLSVNMIILEIQRAWKRKRL